LKKFAEAAEPSPDQTPGSCESDNHNEHAPDDFFSVLILPERVDLCPAPHASRTVCAFAFAPWTSLMLRKFQVNFHSKKFRHSLFLKIISKKKSRDLRPAQFLI
jgi:hypothetical protein